MRAGVLWIAVLLWLPTSGHASDFWDEVRSPGLHAHVTLLNDAANALRRNEGGRALELTANVAPGFAGRVDSLRVRGLALAATGELQGALQALHRAVAIDPTALDDPPWGPAAALLCAKAGAFSFASEILARVVGNMPAVPVRRELFSLLGDTLLAQGPAHVDAAIVAYREALRGADTSDARSLLGLSLALSRHAEHPSAGEVAARLTAASRIDVVVGALPLPATEKAARLAIAAEAVGDAEAAYAQWTAASEGPWLEHATSEAARMQRLMRPRSGVRRR